MRWLLLAALLGPVQARADGPWDRYQLLMWQDRTPVQMRGLVALGFTGAKLHATGGEVDEPGRAERARAGLAYYLENIATDFYSPYHRYTEGKPVTWLFDAAKARFRATHDPAVFVREPSLSDPAWIARVQARLAAVVRAEQPLHPLFYNLADESGIGDLAAAWDADQSPASLAAMRLWLRTRYPDLAALNRQWGTAFPTWNTVVPELTDAALQRTDSNYSAWMDGKAWMDTAFAAAVRAGTEAVHAADPTARAALEGGQLPGWGGYDYALLAPAVDVMEIYDAGEALDLATAFNPALIPLRTSFGRGSQEVHAMWRNLLHGGRGTIVWDEADDVVTQDGAPAPRGRELSATTAAMAAVAPRVRHPASSGVAMLYSQASFRMTWLLDRQAGDHDWTARDAEREYDDNAWRASRRVIAERLAALGVTPRFISAPMLEAGHLEGIRVLVLPHAIALSDPELAAIAAFRAAGGTVLADTEPGLFDGHGRRRAVSPLPGLPHPLGLRADADETPAALDALAALLAAAHVTPPATVLGPDGQRATGIELRWYEGGALSLQAARPWAAPGRVVLRFPHPMAITDLRQPGATAAGEALGLTLDPVEPRILAAAPAP